MDLKDYLIIFMLIAIIIKIGRKKEKFTLAGVNNNVSEVKNNVSNNTSNNSLQFSRSYNGTLTPMSEDIFNTVTGERTISYLYTDGTREVITKFADGRETHRITGSSGNVILDELYTPPLSNVKNNVSNVNNNVSNNLNNLTAFIATGNGSNLDLNGNVKINGNVEFNSNTTKFKGAGTTTGLDTHFPYVNADGVKANFISGNTFFRDGNVEFNSNITKFKGAGPTANLDTHFPYVNSEGVKANFISGNTLFRDGNVAIDGDLNVLKNLAVTNELNTKIINSRSGFKTSYGANEKITWTHNAVPTRSPKIALSNITDGTYLVLATSNQFSGMNTFSKKGNVIVSSLKDYLVVKHITENINKNGSSYTENNMFVEFNHPNGMEITIMFIKLTDITF